MIKLQDYTPEIYYKESRDFQFIGRLFDIVLNAVKTDADTIYNIPISDNSDDKLIDLMAMTLGFQAKHHYSGKQIRAICKVFPEILRKKGSIEAVLIACNAIFAAEGLEQKTQYDFTGDKVKTLNLYIPQEFKDIVLLNDVLTYVLPAGMSCNIVRELRSTKETKTALDFSSVFSLYSEGDATDGSGDYANIFYDNNKYAGIVKFTNGDESAYGRATGEISTKAAIEALIKDKPGYIGGSGIYVLDTTDDN